MVEEQEPSQTVASTLGSGLLSYRQMAVVAVAVAVGR